MRQQDTFDEINDWALSNYASTAAPSLNAAVAPQPSLGSASGSGMLAATSAPTSMAAPAAPAATSAPATSSTSTWASATSTPAASSASTSSAPASTSASQVPLTPAYAPKANVNINNWYRNELGRDGDAAGVAYWQSRLDRGEDAQAVYAEFSNSAKANAETVKPVDWASANTYTGPANSGASTAPATAASTAAAQIAKADLATRTIDKPTETVQGQIGNVLAENSPVLQQARADAQRQAAERGMLNSSMAASGGEDAVIRSAANIATADAATYGKAADYNVAAQNQATMWNADQVAQMQRLGLQLDDSAAGRAQQLELAKMQDATSRYQAEMSANTSRYSADASYRQQMDNQKNALVNSIISNMDLSPDRKAAMLESLGAGTSARTNPDGTTSPGSGLAGAVYVIGSTTADLQYNPAALSQ